MLNINFWNIAFTIINIVVLYLFLKRFLMKPLMSILEERKQMVEKELDEAADVYSGREETDGGKGIR